MQLVRLPLKRHSQILLLRLEQQRQQTFKLQHHQSRWHHRV
jgi:hypothetical protein